jgi:hypothetical protein
LDVKIHKNSNVHFITIDGYLLTTCYSLEDEKKRFLEMINYELRNTTIIIFGLGLGTYVEDLDLKLHPSNSIVVVEPQQNILDYYHASNKVVNSIRMHLINASSDELIDFLDKNGINTRFKVVYGYMNYRNIFRIEFKEIVEGIRNDSVVKLGNEATLRKYDREFTINAFRNYFFNEFHFPINVFKDEYKDIPALIVSAGPSLEKHIDLINSFQGIIFSGGRTILEFLNRDIRVDFMVSIDPTDKVYELVAGADKIGIMPPLFTFLQSNHNVIEHHNSHKILMNTPSAPILFESGRELDIIMSGPSVANVAVSIAKYLGCNPVVLIGQDLSYTEGKHHADISVMEFDIEPDKRQLTMEVDGYYNSKVKTSPSFYSMLKWFENWIEKHEGTYINATEGGVSIRGCTQMPFQTYLEEQSEVSFEYLHSKFTYLCEDTPIYKGKLDVDAYFEKLLSLNYIINKIIFHSQKIVNCVKSKKESNIKQHLAELIKLEVKIDKEMKNDQMLNYLFASAVYILENNKRLVSKNENLSTANNNLLFYRNLSENVQYLISWLKENKDA